MRTLFKLDDGHDDFDHVGRMAEELTANQVVAAEELAVIGLTERYAGLLDTV